MSIGDPAGLIPICAEEMTLQFRSPRSSFTLHPRLLGTIIDHTARGFLRKCRPNGRALSLRASASVREGFQWQGLLRIHTASRKWPDWTPPPEMIERQPTCPALGRRTWKPMGARALYLGEPSIVINATISRRPRGGGFVGMRPAVNWGRDRSHDDFPSDAKVMSGRSRNCDH